MDRAVPPSQRRIVIPPASAGRLDRVAAAAWPDLSRSRLQRLIRGGSLRIDGRIETDPAARAEAGAAIALDLPPPTAAEPAGEALPLDILYEDGDLIVLDKPPGMVVHPAPGHPAGTLVNALIAHCGASLSGIGGVLRPGIVHRLDRDTSGVMVVAKSDRAHQGLARQFADHGRSGPLERAYLALVWGAPQPPAGVIAAPLRRSPHNPEKIAVAGERGGRSALTRYESLESFVAPSGEPVATLLRCRLETGRTHQIRVHMAHQGHPLLGDPLYGGGFKTKASRLGEEGRAALAALGRQALHAETLAFAHPVTGELHRFTRPPPPDLARLIAALRQPAADHATIGHAIGREARRRTISPPRR